MNEIKSGSERAMPEEILKATVARPAAAPRVIGAKARRRSWNEPQVRFWWLAGMVVAGVAVYFITAQFWYWFNERQLLRNGTKVEAVIEEVGGRKASREKYSPDTNVTLKFDWKGESRTVTGYLVDRTAPMSCGEKVTIHVDAENAENWTGRTELPSLGRELVAVTVLLPIIPVAFFAGLLARRRVLKIWRDGMARQGVVVESRTTATAPLSHAVRCVLRDGHEQRLVTVFIPHKAGNPKEGDVLWLITPSSRSRQALAAMLFE